MRVRHAALGVLAALGVVAAAAGTVRGADSPATDVMEQLSRAVRELSGAFDRGDLDAARRFAPALDDAARALGSVSVPLDDRREADGFATLRERLAETALEIDGHAHRGDLRAGRAALDALRATCVGCHARYRPGGLERGAFPARGRTVSGTVLVESPSGEARADARDVVVFLEGGPSSQAAPHGERRHRVVQRGRQFVPRVLPITRGAVVEFPNEDAIFHNVFSLSRARPFDLGVYRDGATRAVRFEKTGLVRVHCNIHPQMSASILVLGGPWHDVTTPDGRFAISGVPPGAYTLRTWHALGGDLSMPLEIESTDPERFTLTMRETRTAVPHRDKHGRPYDGKYD